MERRKSLGFNESRLSARAKILRFFDRHRGRAEAQHCTRIGHGTLAGLTEGKGKPGTTRKPRKNRGFWPEFELGRRGAGRCGGPPQIKGYLRGELAQGRASVQASGSAGQERRTP
jgi:hypothetical protein